MKRHYSFSSLLLALSLITIIACDEPGDFLFKNKGYDTGAGIAQLNDGNYLMLGTACGTDEITDFILVKADQTGKILWNKRFGGSSYEDASAIKATPDGGAILVGDTYSYGPGIENGYWNMWIVKVDANGNKQWDAVCGVAEPDGARAIVLLDNGYLVTGYTHDPAQPGACVYRLDSKGRVLWSRNYGHGCADAATVAADGNVVLAMTNISSMYDESTDILLVKIDSNGDVLWKKTAGTAGHDAPASIVSLSDGTLVVAGNRKASSTANLNGLVIRTDARGNTLWLKELPLSSNGAVTALAIAADGNILMAGDKCIDNWYNDFWVVKFAFNGNELFNTTCGTSKNDTLAGIIVDNSGDIVVAGHTITDITTYLFDLYAVRLGANGEL